MSAAVYVLRNGEGEAIYVGRSQNVPRRLQVHRRRPWASEIAAVEVYPAPSNVAVEEMEKVYIAELRPRYNEIVYIAQIGSPQQTLPEHAAQQLRAMLEAERTVGYGDSPQRQRLDNFIRLLRVNGWTLAAIGEPLGWTREAVRRRDDRGRLEGHLPIPPLPPRAPTIHVPPQVRRLHVRPEVAARLVELHALASQCRGGVGSSDPRRIASVELSAALGSLVAQGVTAGELARIIGVTRNALVMRLARHGYGEAPPSQTLIPFGTRRVGDSLDGKCRRGHAMTGDNLRVTVPGQHRVCRACERIRVEAYRNRKRSTGLAA